MSRDQPKALKHVTENVVTDSLLRDAIQRVLTSLCYWIKKLIESIHIHPLRYNGMYKQVHCAQSLVFHLMQ